MKKKPPPTTPCGCPRDKEGPGTKTGSLSEADKTDYQVTKETLDRLTVPYIRPMGVPPPVPKNSNTALCLCVGDYWNGPGLCLCFDRNGAYTGVLAGKKFVEAGNTDHRSYLH